MATFLRRTFAKLSESRRAPQVGATFSRPEGAITLTAREAARYGMLMTMLDTDSDDQIGGAEGASFLRRSGLDTDALREIWRLASGGTSKTRLSREDFYVACKLIAVAQVKGTPSMEPLLHGEALPLADFHYDLVPDMSAIAAGSADASQVPPAAIKVSVSEPTSYGSGLSKHTRYRVTTTTSLPQFSRKEMVVWRRFSDFEWLNARLSTKFPATIIPLFPEKRLVGNTDADFVRDRMAGLEVFVDKVAHHAVLNTSLDLLVFLDATDEGVEAAKRYIEEKEAEEAESMLAKGVDLVMNYAVTGSAAPPLAIKADEEFVEACATHGAALARLSSGVKMAVYLDATGREAAESMGNLGRALQALAAHEQAHAGAGAAAALAVSSAKTSAQRSAAALFSGEVRATGGGDSAAAAAFNAHSQAAAAGRDGSVAGMFSGDFSDPYAAVHASAPPGSSSGGAGLPPSSSPTEDLAGVCVAVGAELVASGKKLVEQLGVLDDALYKPMRTARDQEAELGEAIRRRDAAIDKVQEANATLQRKKKASAALKPETPNYAALNAQATEAVAKAEVALASRRDELEKMTAVLKLEMARVSRARRQQLGGRLAEYARLQASFAAARGDGWNRVLPLCGDARARQASQEAVSVIAHKAEEKARRASQVARQQRQQGQAGGSIVAAPAPATIGGDDAPIPTAAEL